MTDDALLKLWGKTDPNDPDAFHPLLYHMLDVAAVCEALLHRFPPPDPLSLQWVAYLASLHDIGKADPLFQGKVPELVEPLRDLGLDIPPSPDPFRHEARSAEWVMRHLMQSYGWNRRSAGVVSLALHGHHGDFASPGNAEEQTHPARFAQWHALRDALAAALFALLVPPPLRFDQFEDASVAGVRLSGVIVLADWIASNEELFHYRALAMEAPSPAHYLAAARVEAARVVGRLQLGTARPAPPETPPLSFPAIWPHLPDRRPTQRALEDVCLTNLPPPGLAIIEAPMGEGKTEAAIYLAEHWRRATGRDGAYIALPTAATSNQMHDRYAAFIAERHPAAARPRLVHGMAWLLDDDSPLAPPNLDADEEDAAEQARSLDWFRPTKRALLAPEGVGTIDQALMAALHVRHGFLRLLGLGSKVLIVDEVHAYDAYMTTILERLLAWCRALGTPVILLSATLSHAQKQRLAHAYAGSAPLPPAADVHDPYPLLTFVSPEGDARMAPVRGTDALRRRLRIQCHRGLLHDPDATARLVAVQVSAGGCACVLANTVNTAQAIYRALLRMRDSDPEFKDTLRDCELLLFHARFRAERRQDVERQVVDLFGSNARKEGKPTRPRRAILVATQVVEQSLDVDFDVMVSDLAPVDLLLQRSGRLHRHERGIRPTGSDPVLHVLLPDAGSYDFGNTGRIYQPEPLLRTLALLAAYPEFHLPAHFRPLIEGCYGEAPLPDGVVDPACLARAAADHQQALAREASLARQHLIPEPNPRAFRLTETGARPVDEADEGEAADYFHARTRLGDRTRAALALHDPDLVDVTRADYPPERALLRRLFLQKVDIPAWWLNGLLDAEGREPDFTGPKWLRHHLVIPMTDWEWRGLHQASDGHRRPVILRDDPALGLLRIAEGETNGDL
ncbi:MAG: CRISPR-associated helicase Cas3' [Armatimonadetes bacterium]|nr:CRISPR-associated helicase Cas3' [Armatimonadota bacterium]